MDMRMSCCCCWLSGSLTLLSHTRIMVFVGDNFALVDWTYLITTLSTLVRHTHSSISAQALPPTLIQSSTHTSATLSPADRSLLLSKSFLTPLFLDATTRRRGHAIGAIVCHQCWGDAEVSQNVVAWIAAAMEEVSSEQRLTGLPERSHTHALLTRHECTAAHIICTSGMLCLFLVLYSTKPSVSVPIFVS